MNLISRTLLRGAILLLPALITLWLLWTALAGLDQFGAALLRLADWDDPAPGAGLALIMVLMVVSGALIPINPMSWLFDRIEDWFMRFPLIKTVYGATRDFVRLMDKERKQEFKQAVLVEVPGLGPAIGFVTAEHLPNAVTARLDDAEARVPVYLPLSYQIGGFTLFIARAHITPVEWPFEEAMRYVMTAGVSGTDD
jgi:uncharacterized membrane protein